MITTNQVIVLNSTASRSTGSRDHRGTSTRCWTILTKPEIIQTNRYV